MRKFLMITSALVCLGGAPAKAGPIMPIVQGVTQWYAGLGALGQAVAQIGASVALNAISTELLSRGVKQQDIRRELQQPNSLTVKRFVYGKCWAPGSPAPVRSKGDKLYCCYLLNSRPSAGPFTLYLDKREVEVEPGDDPYDFAGPGARASNSPFSWKNEDISATHARYWIGRGDQTRPPQQILDEAPDLFKVTDGWRGQTVIWIRLRSGGNKTFTERWPNGQPEVMVDGRWSMVRDPRLGGARSWSANQALCTLDALRENPLRPYDSRNLWIDTFQWAADVADEPFPVKAGGTIPKFEVNGVLAFSEQTELEDQILPLVNAGASRLIRAGGRLGLVPAVYQEPVMTISDVLGDQPMTFNRHRPSGELVTEVTATYTSPLRMYEEATTPIFILPGAQAEDGGTARPGRYDLGLVTDHRQAQYVAAIMGRRTRMQRSWSGVLPGQAFDLVALSVMQLDLPAPYLSRSGIYEVEMIHPGFDPIGLEGSAMRCPVSLRETSPAIYTWNPATDEQDVTIEDFDPDVKGVKPPENVTLLSDASTVMTSGDTTIARIRFSFDPSPSSSTLGYGWEYRQGSDPWQAGGSVESDVVDGAGKVFGYLAPVELGSPYWTRVWTIAPSGTSEQVVAGPITASAGAFLAPAPTPISAIGGTGQIAVTFRSPNNSHYRAMEIYVADVDNAGAAVLLLGPIYGSANAAVTEVHTGLGPGATRYYFARSIDRNGNPSTFSASISATTT